MSTTSTVLKIIIPLAFFLVIILIIFGGSGLFTEAKEAILSAKDFLPKLSIGLEEQKAYVTIPEAHRAEVQKLGDTIFGMLKSGKENCFANYKFSAPADGKTSLVFVSQEDKTSLVVTSGAGGKQEITSLRTDFPVMKPCVIAGPDNEAENFFYNFIEKRTSADQFAGTEGSSAEGFQGQGGADAGSESEPQDGEAENLRRPYFKKIDSMAVLYDGTAKTIFVQGLGLENDLEDNGWLFTPDGEHICFFPTNSVSDYAESGIDNDYFTPEETNSIPNKIAQGELKICN